MRSDRAELIARYPFSIDGFQATALNAFDDGRHVVVAAPTGSGKTVIAEYGIAATVRDGRRAFYTAPIKALSNQKYRDLVDVHGIDQVGLLTGDNSINGHAPIVVMTTEVLRNMIYGRNRRLDDLGLVVLDEVHFLQDAYRGPVWEEVMVHLPEHVRLICLSATVSNAAELAEWIETVRGPTESVVEQRRPVELVNHFLAKDRDRDRLHLVRMFADGGVNRDAIKLDESAIRRGPRRDSRGNGARERRVDETGRRRRLVPPGRVETVGLLGERSMLPAIFFIFSRNQCDEAAATCLEAGVRLTTDAEQRQIRTIIDERLGRLDSEDLDVLGFDRFVRQLEAGIAAHHAGMVPPMKEVVEACFIAGLIKVVFATETLAVGINMPARSVVIEKLTKFTGEHHEQLTPGEYTQLTGRAGRRGIDDLGNAIVLWSPWTRFDEVAEIAASSAFHLRSVFKPTYNMTANLIRTYDRDVAYELLNLSFGQFQADRDIVRLQARLERRRRALAQTRADAESPYGDIDEYIALRDQESDRRRGERDAKGREIAEAMRRLKPGVVISVSKGRDRGEMVVMTNAHRKGESRLTVVDRSGKRLQVGAEDFDDVPVEVARIEMPPNFAPNRKEYRKQVAYRLRSSGVRTPGRSTKGRDRRAFLVLDEHPVAEDPRLRQRLQAAGTAARIGREVAHLESRIERRHGGLAQDFDRVLSVLRRFGYVDADGWGLTASGDILARLFHESDLLIAEALRSGVLDDLNAADVAALVSCIVYEHRSPEPPAAPWFASDDVRRRWERLAAMSEDLAAHERAAGLSSHRPPDPSFAAIAHAWVAGEGFAEVVDDEQVSGGDFVRTMRQLIDVLRQVALVAPDRGTRRAAASAADRAFRGVVEDSAALDVAESDDG